MATEHTLISLLEGCLTCAPSLQSMPLGAKVQRAIDQFYQAQALGFQSTEEMAAHVTWLKEHGTAEYKAWLLSLPPALPTGEPHVG